MATADDVRAIALSLDGVVEIDSDGFDFRVLNKGFVWSYPDRSGGRRLLRLDVAVLYVGDEAVSRTYSSRLRGTTGGRS